MIKVKNTVGVYEVDGNDVDSSNHKVEVISHWNYNELVVISTGAHRFTVNARDLKAAIDNATNVNRF